MNNANIVKNKTFQFGSFHEPFKQNNLIEASIYSFPVPRFFKNYRLKEFQACQGGNEQFYFCVALFNAKASALVQIRVFDKINKKHHVIEDKVSPFKLKLANQLYDSINEYQGKKLSVKIENKLNQQFIALSFETEEISANLKGIFNVVDQMISVIPFAKNRGMYSHKSFVPMQGEIIIEGRNIELNKSDSFFVLDDHKGYYPYKMWWDWISFAFFHEGKRIGVNLTVNQSIKPEEYNENAIWINNDKQSLPLVVFKRDKEVWNIQSACKTIDLIFVATYPKSVKINLGILGGSDYEGPFGHVSGKIILNDKELIFSDKFAFAEKQMIRC